MTLLNHLDQACLVECLVQCSLASAGKPDGRRGLDLSLCSPGILQGHHLCLRTECLEHFDRRHSPVPATGSLGQHHDPCRLATSKSNEMAGDRGRDPTTTNNDQRTAVTAGSLALATGPNSHRCSPDVPQAHHTHRQHNEHAS